MPCFPSSLLRRRFLRDPDQAERSRGFICSRCFKVFLIFVLFSPLERLFNNSLVAICLKGENAHANELPEELILTLFLLLHFVLRDVWRGLFCPRAVTSARLPLQPPHGLSGGSGFPAGALLDGRPSMTSCVSIIPRRRKIKGNDLTPPRC